MNTEIPTEYRTRNLGGTKYYTNGQLAKLLGVDRMTVRRWLYGRKLELVSPDAMIFIDPANGYVYFSEQSVRIILAAYRSKTIAKLQYDNKKLGSVATQ